MTEANEAIVKYHYDVIQNSDEWFSLRKGIITASKISKILTPTLKVADNKDSRAIVYEMVAERSCDFIEDNFQSYDMQRGHTEETWAKQVYHENVAHTKDCGFITNEKLGFTLGYSPDWLIGEDGQAEVKSHKSYLQVKTILDDKLPEENKIQVQAGLYISERSYCDFVSYGNGYPMMISRVYPDDDIQNAIAEACSIFEARVNEELERYLNLITDLKRFIPTERKDPETFGMKSSDNEPIDYTMAG